MSADTTAKLSNQALWAACALLCLYFFASFLFLVFTNVFPGPFFDYWADSEKIIHYFDSSAELTLDEMLSLHNGAHRLFIPRILFILDHLVANGTNILLISVSIVCKLSVLALLNYFVRHATVKDKLILNTLFFAGLFHISSMPWIVINSNIQWDLMLTFSFLSIYFFHRSLSKQSQLVFAYLFATLSFFSHAGGLALPVLFVALSYLSSDKKNFWLHLIFFFTITSLHFIFLPEWIDESASKDLQRFKSQDINAKLVGLLYFFPNFIVRLIYAPARGLDNFALYFSFFFVYWFFILFRSERKTREPNNPIFLYATFLLLAIAVIAMGRIPTNPYFYGAAQYHSMGVMFIVTVSAALFLKAPTLYSNKKAGVVRTLVILHCLGVLLLGQIQQTPGSPYKRSNRALNTHALMFLHERNHFQGKGLKVWKHEHDEIEAIDPLYASHNFAYYHNKQGGQDRYKTFIQPGRPFVAAEFLQTFQQSCSTNTSTITYKHKNGVFLFSTAINLDENNYIGASILRNSYYVLDRLGMVIGFAYTHMPAEQWWPRPELQGYVKQRKAVFIAEVQSGQPVCLYQLINKTPS